MFSFANPMLLWGSLAIASPIIIHLLSKRRFKVMEWAAIDFLMEADRRNRRRIRLEHLLLLLLRCLALILLALAVARPFLKPSAMAASALKISSVERIIILDDSPSMSATSANRSSLQNAVEGLSEFLRQIARDRPGDTITLLLTSKPEHALLRPGVGADKIEEVVRLLTEVKVSDKTANLDRALLTVEETIEKEKAGLNNRALYIVSDLRQRDWLVADKAAASPGGLPGAAPAAPAGGPGSAAEDRSTPGILRRLSRDMTGTYVVDVGYDRLANLTVAEITPLETSLIAGVDSRFEASIINHGYADVDDIEVSFIVGQGVPLTSHISKLGAGQRTTVSFTTHFREPKPEEVRVELPPDSLPSDNIRYYAARVRTGRDILIVDGNPSSERGESESFFLKFALAPPGDVAAGNNVEVLTENEFEGLNLDKFQLIYLCDLYRVSDEMTKSLETWIKAGGVLGIFLGEQVDPQGYNDRLYRAGAGLLPVQLTDRKGDETEQEFVNFVPVTPNHPAVSVFEGDNNPFVRLVKIYQWFGSKAAAEDLSTGRVKVLARYSDQGEGDQLGSPAIVERVFGDGRVLLFATTAGGKWNDWPLDPTFIVSMQEMARALSRRTVGEGSGPVGAPLRYDLDPAKHQLEVVLTSMGQEPTGLTAAAEADGKKMVVHFEDANKAGFYHMALRRRDSASAENDQALFAVNIDPTEGDVRPVDMAELHKRMGDANVEFLKGKASLTIASAGGGTELWRPIILALLAILCVESVLAWSFGRKR